MSGSTRSSSGSSIRCRSCRRDRVFPGNPGHTDSTRVSRAQYQYTLVATDRAEVIEWSDKLVRRLRGNSTFGEVASEAQEGGPRMQIEVDREQAGRLGVSMQSVTDTLNDAFGQRQISTIYGQANQYRVIPEAQPRYQQDPNALSKILRYGRQHIVGPR